jgi:UDP-3-O-[3-hydroxymyristoyl] N-acetylglucosamine deacetylase/3-hydroxyacyl-[acyl-carrier-protein] dehydratase
MLPGLIAGHYRWRDAHIDLRVLPSRAGTMLVTGSVVAIDRDARIARCDDGTLIAYDACSIDVGSVPSMAARGAHEHVIAIKPSHAANCELAREITAQMRKPLPPSPKTFAPPPQVSDEDDRNVRNGSQKPAMDIDEIMRLLPHRYPFLMVDRVTKVEGNKITALKNVSVNELYFQGHFPGHPIMPGVLQLEAIAQVAGILMLKQVENQGKIAYFMSAESVKWRAPVRPGDTLMIDVELTKTRGKIGKAKGVCSVAGSVVSEAEVTFMIVEGSGS